MSPTAEQVMIRFRHQAYSIEEIPPIHWTDPRDAPGVPHSVMASKSRVLQRRQWEWRRNLVPAAEINPNPEMRDG
jgi:hypothetical protein